MKVLHPFLIDSNRTGITEAEEYLYFSLIGRPNILPLTQNAFVREFVAFNPYTVIEFRNSSRSNHHQGMTFHDCFKSWLDSKISNKNWHRKLVREGYSALSRDLYILCRDDAEGKLSLHSIIGIVMTPLVLAVHLSDGRLIEEVLNTADDDLSSMGTCAFESILADNASSQIF